MEVWERKEQLMVASVFGLVDPTAKRL